MKFRSRSVVLALFVVASAFAIAGCGTWLFPAIDGTWQMYGDMTMEGASGGTAVASGLIATFDGGSFRFAYEVTDPYPDGPAEDTWFKGALSPPDPEVGTNASLTVEEVQGANVPPVGTVLGGTVLVLDRRTLVLDMDMDGPDSDITQAWSFVRQ